MNNLNIGPKTDGDPSVNGRLTAAEINLIVQKINELVTDKLDMTRLLQKLNETVVYMDDANFDGTGAEGDKIRIKQALLDKIEDASTPNTSYLILVDTADDKIYQYQSVNGVLQGVEITAIPANPPSGISVQDGGVNPEDNKLLFTRLPNVSYRGTLDGGAHEFDITAGISYIQVGNVAKAPGTVGVKVKAKAGEYGESEWVFNEEAFEYTLIAPGPPTIGEVHDEIIESTFEFITAPGYTDITKYEFSLNAGVSWQDVTVNPIVIGNIDLAADQLVIRVKEVVGVSHPGVSLTYSGTFKEIEIILPINDSSYTNLVEGYSEVIGDNTGFKFVNTGGGFGHVFTNKKISAGEKGSLIMDISSDSGAVMILDRVFPSDDQPPASDFSMQYVSSNGFVSGNGLDINGSTQGTGYYNNFDTRGGSNAVAARIRVDLDFVYFEYTLHRDANPIVWVTLGKALSIEPAQTKIPRPAGDLYVRFFCYNGRTNAYIRNPRGKNLKTI